MENLLFTAFIIAGLLMLYFGGDFLVHGSSSLAKRLNIPPIVIGLTVVAFGTSSPELFVSMFAAIQGKSDISLGNIIGSNIMNTALVLGITSIAMPLSASKQTVKVDIPFMLGTFVLLLAASINWQNFGKADIFTNGTINPIEGAVLAVLLIAYVLYLYKSSANKPLEEIEEIDVDEVKNAKTEAVPISILKIAGGLIGLAVGAKLLIEGALGLLGDGNNKLIGLTIAAIGTSLPELVTSVVAITKNEMDISLGNIIGSNIFNSLLVVGLAGIVKGAMPGENGVRGLLIKESFVIDFSVMILYGILLLIFLLGGKKMSRVHGVFFLISYAGYIIYLIANGQMPAA